MVISVIVPVYNIEKKKRVFEASIESVLKQSYRDFELIIVNDGSMDKTEVILRELEKKDKRIRIVIKENGGVEDAFELFIHKMKETNADVVVANHIRFIFNPFFSFGKCNAASMQRERIIDHESFMDQYYVSFFGMNDLPVNIGTRCTERNFWIAFQHLLRRGIL